MSDEDFDVRKMWRDADPAHRGAVLLCIMERCLELKPSTMHEEVAEISRDVAAQNARRGALSDAYAVAATLLQSIAEETP